MYKLLSLFLSSPLDTMTLFMSFYQGVGGRGGWERAERSTGDHRDCLLSWKWLRFGDDEAKATQGSQEY